MGIKLEAQPYSKVDCSIAAQRLTLLAFFQSPGRAEPCQWVCRDLQPKAQNSEPLILSGVGRIMHPEQAPNEWLGHDLTYNLPSSLLFTMIYLLDGIWKLLLRAPRGGAGTPIELPHVHLSLATL
jgi:hypothetical protein